jgi:hypothetical protein
LQDCSFAILVLAFLAHEVFPIRFVCVLSAHDVILQFSDIWKLSQCNRIASGDHSHPLGFFAKTDFSRFSRSFPRALNLDFRSPTAIQKRR